MSECARCGHTRDEHPIEDEDACASCDCMAWEDPAPETLPDQLALLPGGPPVDRAGPRASTTPQQYKILARARADGVITPAIAGTILHEHRGHCGHGAKGGRHTGGKSSSCCAYASSDGLEALKRLVRRGLLAHTAKGRYVPVEVAEWSTEHLPQVEREKFPHVQARARKTDPVTSHEAAASHAPLELNEKRRAVLAVLRTVGPMADEQWIGEYFDRMDGGLLAQSQSGLRTRRAELVEMGLVGQFGETKIRNRRVIVWGVIE